MLCYSYAVHNIVCILLKCILRVLSSFDDVQHCDDVLENLMHAPFDILDFL